MNHRVATMLAAISLLGSGSAPALAAGTTSVNVTATVLEVCKFTASTMADIALPTINPSTVAADVTKDGDITYQCTNGTTPTVSIQTGTTARTLTDGAKTINYTFTLGTPMAGTGFSTSAASAKVVATATIAKAAAQDAQAGTYSDTVTLSINY